MSFNEWEKVKIQDIVTKLGDGLHGTPKYDDFGDYYFINGNNLIEGNIVIKDGTKRISFEEYLKHKKELNDRTILLGINGTIGNVALYNGEKCILGKSACYFNVINTIDKNFIKYMIMSNDFQSYIKNTANGTTIKNVSLKSIREFEFRLPKLDIQQKISSILSSIDNKIQLNRNIQKTLETLALTIFNEICLPKSEDLLNGWKIEKLDNLIETVSITHKMKQEKIIFLNTSDILEGNVLNNDYSIVSTLPGQAKKSIKRNDILFSEIRPANKRYAFVNFDADDYVVSTKLMVLRTKSINPYLIYCFLTNNDTLKELQHLAETRSGTFPQITFSQLKDFQIAIPDEETLSKVSKNIQDIYENIFLNYKETQTLIALRDNLLPKLMKGEIAL